MTHPLTPREKVLLSICENKGRTSGDLADAILTALASGSGDHAELAREIERTSFWREARDSRDFVIDEPCDADDCGAEERPAYAEWVRKSVISLIAENAALRASIGRHDRQVSGMLRARLAAETRATQAERKLAEADQVIRDIAETPYTGADWPRSRAATYIASKEAERG